MRHPFAQPRLASVRACTRFGGKRAFPSLPSRAAPPHAPLYGHPRVPYLHRTSDQPTPVPPCLCGLAVKGMAGPPSRPGEAAPGTLVPGSNGGRGGGVYGGGGGGSAGSAAAAWESSPGAPPRRHRLGGASRRAGSRAVARQRLLGDGSGGGGPGHGGGGGLRAGRHLPQLHGRGDAAVPAGRVRQGPGLLQQREGAAARPGAVAAAGARRGPRGGTRRWRPRRPTRGGGTRFAWGRVAEGRGT